MWYNRVCLYVQELPLDQQTLPPISTTPHCPFKDVELNGLGYCTVLLENPKGHMTLSSHQDAETFARQIK